MTDKEIKNCPVVWFAKLDRAIESGDFSAAATAQAELKRLGFDVRHRPNSPQKSPRKEASNAS